MLNVDSMEKSVTLRTLMENSNNFGNDLKNGPVNKIKKYRYEDIQVINFCLHTGKTFPLDSRV